MNRKFQLPNGLDVELIDKPGFVKQFGIVMVDFGGIDQSYRAHIAGEWRQTRIPAGTAHFIEHQLFNKPTGDISQRFAKHHAETNAFTSPTKTGYFFSSTSQLSANLDLLAELVSQPYFQPESVSKERAIITQELNLYQDQPDYRLENQLITTLYGEGAPMATDIAGTPASLKSIDSEILLKIHQTFYQPQNMKLVIVADLSRASLADYWQQPDNAWTALRRRYQIERETASRPAKLAIKADSVLVNDQLQVNKLALGWRGASISHLTDVIRLQIDLELVMTTLFGETAERYRKWRNSGLINDSFQFQTTVERGNNHLIFTANTPDPQRLQSEVQEVIAGLSEADLANFEIVRQDMLGNLLFAEDEIEGIGQESVELAFYDWPLDQFKQQLQQRRLSESLVNVQQFFAHSERASYTMLRSRQEDDNI